MSRGVGNQRVSTGMQSLVDEVTVEMIQEGSRYMPRPCELRYKCYAEHGKVITPEFPGLLSRLCKDKPVEQLPVGVQFRGTPVVPRSQMFPVIRVGKETLVRFKEDPVNIVGVSECE